MLATQPRVCTSQAVAAAVSGSPSMIRTRSVAVGVAVPSLWLMSKHLHVAVKHSRAANGMQRLAGGPRANQDMTSAVCDLGKVGAGNGISDADEHAAAVGDLGVDADQRASAVIRRAFGGAGVEGGGVLDHPDRGGRVGLTAHSRDTACDDSALYVERGAEGPDSGTALRCGDQAAPPRFHRDRCHIAAGVGGDDLADVCVTAASMRRTALACPITRTLLTATSPSPQRKAEPKKRSSVSALWTVNTAAIAASSMGASAAWAAAVSSRTAKRVHRRGDGHGYARVMTWR